MKNYSRQREAILEVLRSTDTHPTANWIYTKVKERIPNISLGTVYRNLKGLTEDKDIISLNLGDGFERFDGNPLPHLHMHCKCCGNVTDAYFKDDILSLKAMEQGFTPENSLYIVYGICKNCKKN